MARLQSFRTFAILMTIVFFVEISLIYKDFYISRYPIFKNLVSNGMFNFSMFSETSNPISADTILKKGNGILFMETTDRMDPPSLVLYSIEAATRTYPDRPVVFFMKGLGDIITEKDEETAKQLFPTLSSFDNVYLFPLRMDQLFNNTPLKPWYNKVNPKKEIYWTHVTANACRLALMWIYGGIYLDCDLILLRPIPKDHFLGAQHVEMANNAAFGLPSHHKVAWQLMENFVENYKGDIWGHQGPRLFDRILYKLCGKLLFKSIDDLMCANITYYHPRRFYPIYYTSWKRFYEVWQHLPNFTDSYAVHFWRKMNNEGASMVPGSNTLAEHLYQKYCPTTYDYILRNPTHKKVL